MNHSPLSNRRLDHAGAAEYPGAKVPLVEAPGAQPQPPVVRTREPGLLTLPHELQLLITHHMVPPYPYLARPHGSRVGHVPIAPALRALANWGASCSWANMLVAAIRKDVDHKPFRRLAGSAEFAFGKESESARRAVVSRYDIDPDGVKPSPYSLQLNIVRPDELEPYLRKLDQNVSQIRTLEINCWCDTIPNPARLATLIACCTGVQRLRLQSVAPFEPALLDALQTLPALRTLELLAPRFPVDLFARLARLPACATLECLVIDDGNPGVEQIATLAQCGSAFAQLRFLTLQAPALAAPLCTALARALATLQRLESLQVGKKEGRLSAAGVLALVQAARQGNRITRIGLHGLEEDPTDGESASVLTQLRAYPDLQELALSGPLDAASVVQLRAMLTDPALRLYALDLEACQLGEQAMCALALGIQSNTSLRELRLAREDISAPVAQSLARALTANTSLLRLTFDDCSMQLAQARILNSILYESAALREFHLTLDEQQNADAHQIARAFATAARRSSILLQMTMGPTVRDGLAQAQNRLAENRRRLQPGLDT